MRAASMDFRTARMLGVRANRVIGGAVLISGVLAAVVAVMLTVQTPLVTPDFALRDTIVVLAGVVLGGLNRLVPATLGGFAIGFASGLLGGALPTTQSQYLPSFLFAAVILVLLVRPERPLHARREPAGARVRRARTLVQLAAPCALVVAVGAARHASSRASSEGYFVDTLVKVAIVVALYVFIGNSGVLSFGHVSFVALGVWTAGVLTVPAGEKPAIMPNLADFLRARRPSATCRRCCSPRSPAASSRSSSASPLMRLSGPRRRHRDVRRARDHAQRAPLLREDRPRPEHVLVGARDDRALAGVASAR